MTTARASRTLQLCRPLSGAVSKELKSGRQPGSQLQLCRPLSGAVRNAPNARPRR